MSHNDFEDFNFPQASVPKLHIGCIVHNFLPSKCYTVDITWFNRVSTFLGWLFYAQKFFTCEKRSSPSKFA